MSSEIVEITIRDGSGAKVDFFKWVSNNKEIERRILNTLKQKYGIFQYENRDLSWAKNSG